MEKLKYDNYTNFRVDVLHKTGVSFCTRKHFGSILPGEEEKYIRLAYSGIDVDVSREGLIKFKKFAEK
jgi:hypothetical protein